MRLDARDWLRARRLCPDGVSIWFVEDLSEPLGLLLALLHLNGSLELPAFPFDRVRDERAQGLARSFQQDLPATPTHVLASPSALRALFGEHLEVRDLGRWNASGTSRRSVA